jgi:hypothetical protein
MEFDKREMIAGGIFVVLFKPKLAMVATAIAVSGREAYACAFF